MTREEYLARRRELMAQAESQIKAAETAAAETTMEEVRNLDAQWDAICTAMANAAALAGEVRPINLQTGLKPDGEAIDNIGGGEQITAASDIYKEAWALSMMGKPLTADQDRAMKLVNEDYTHTTKNTPLVIPETVAAGIWEMVGELYPYWNDVSKTYVTGTLKVIKEGTSSEAKWYEEATKTEDGKETFESLSLSGCELARAITVSWKLREMSISDFIPYIQRRLARKMGAALGYGATHGAGIVTGKAPEPLGIVTSLEKQENTPQITTYTVGKLSYKDLTKARSKVKSGYGTGLHIYANSNTIWNELANVVDTNNRPLFVSSVADGSVGRVLGMAVKEDDSMQDGEILMSNPLDGYIANVNKQMSLSTEEHVKEREADYCAYAIVDGTVMTEKAHSLLKYATAAAKA